MVPVVLLGAVPVTVVRAPVPVALVVPVPVRPPQSAGMVAVVELDAPGAPAGLLSVAAVGVVLVALPEVPAAAPVVPTPMPAVLVADGVQLVVEDALRFGVWPVELGVCVGMPVLGPLDTVPLAPPLWTVAVPLVVPVVPVLVELVVWAATQAAETSSSKLVNRSLFILPIS